MKLIRIINLLFLISFCPTIFSQNGKVRQEKLSRFELQSSSLISEPGEVLSTSGLLQAFKVEGWNVEEIIIPLVTGK
jgi:hypothetical protein